MLRLTLNILKRNASHYYKPLFRFSSDNEPPKGFKKFQRKSKPVEEQAEEKKETKADEKKPDDKEEPTQEEKPVEEKPKKKYNFTYDPKSFNINDKPAEEEPEQQPPPEDPKPKKNIFEDLEKYFKNPKNQKYLLLFLGVGSLGVALAVINQEETITYNDFIKNYLEANQVQSITIYKVEQSKNTVASIRTVRSEYKNLVLGNVDHFLENLERIQLEKGFSKDQFITVEFKNYFDTSKMLDRAVNIIYLAVSVFIAYSLLKQIKSSMGGMKGGGGDGMGFGKFNAKQFGFEQSVKVKFKDVAGLDEAKTEIREFVDFLKKPRKYKEMGAKIPRGALLAGPPGTGKTMIAKACAGEAGVPFFYVSGSDFVEIFVGVGASRVRDLFKQAKAKSPSIIFIDEIDAVGRKRENKVGGNDERDNTLNQLLVEMDGFGTDSNVIVLAATNRKELLDSALTRPGRFDRTVDITLPDIEGRKQVFMVHLAPIKLDPSKSMEDYAKRLATLTPGFSGAEISNLCNEAAIMAARANKLFVDSFDFEMAAERVMAGLEKKKIISEEERKIIAYHESGHAVVSWFLEGGHPLLKLTIIPRSKGSLGYAQYLPNESSLENKSELMDRICCILGGRISEEIFFGQVTTGAYDDLKRAYELAHAIVTKYGMSDNIGFVGFQETEFSKPYSDQTNKVIDDEIRAIIETCTLRTRELLHKHKQDVDNLSLQLLEKETLDLQKIVNILGERPFAPKSNYKAYLDIKRQDEKDEKQEPPKNDQGPVDVAATQN